ncbi:Hypothetical_protein [Hexamita inflata]|uniref:Hypothetical_protein n=1 Tax=Hexamita inflata TaxID=28002 RepID=A0AA86PH00_9EUKA|nr:Hypothetical protein HINF_LOCUS26990 [Hexamita inflata]
MSCNQKMMKNILKDKLNKSEIDEIEFEEYNTKIKDINDKIQTLISKRSKQSKAQKDTTQIIQDIQNLMDERFDLNAKYLIPVSCYEYYLKREIYQPKTIRRVKLVIEPTFEMIQLQKQIKELKYKANLCRPWFPILQALNKYENLQKQAEQLQDKLEEIQDNLINEQTIE